MDRGADLLFLASGEGCELGAGLFFHEQHVVPGWTYLAIYLVVVPLCIYWPTHLILRWLEQRTLRFASPQRADG